MKILVVNNMVPFVRGGAELLADQLVRELKSRDHTVDLLRIPFAWTPMERVYDEMLACRMFELWDVDRVIALKFPAYLVPHPQKTLWLIHQFRQVYDLWPSDRPETSADLASHPLRSTVQAMDNQCFGQARRMFCSSPTTLERLARYNDRQTEVLRAPLNDPDLFRSSGYGDYILAGGRVNSQKRQHLLVEAMRFVTTPVRLVVAGPPDGPEDEQRLRRIVEQHALHDRVELALGYATRQQVATRVNQALACAYLPFEEDTFGYVAMEACQAEKALLTTVDSGGVVEIVADDETGIVVTPDPQSLAQALDELWVHRKRTEGWGRAAKYRWERLGINWDQTVEKLLS